MLFDIPSTKQAMYARQNRRLYKQAIFDLLRWLVLLTVLIFWLRGAETYALEVESYQESGWSEPILLSEGASWPTAVSDIAGNIHVFFADAEQVNGQGGGTAINYMSRKEGQWTSPLDILFSESGEANIMGAGIDDQGYLYLAWGDEGWAYLSRAHILQADNAAAWTTTAILPGALPIGELLIDSHDRLHLFLRDSYFSLVYLFSDDKGTTWSPPNPVDSILNTEEFAIGGPHLAIDRMGNLHATWYHTAAEVDWNNWSVWYGRSSDGGKSWQLIEIADPEYGDSDVAVDGDDNVHLVYGRGIGWPDGRWHTWSDDSGETWHNAQPLYPGVNHASGMTGGSDFDLDSDGNLHLVNSFGNEAGDASAWHMVWQGDDWSEPELLLGDQYHAHGARITIALGNQANFFATSARGADHGLFVLSRTLDAAADEAEMIPLPHEIVLVESNSLDGVSDEVRTLDVPRTVLSDEALSAPSNAAPFNALVVAAGSAALLVLTVVLVLRQQSARRR